jgi:hypothetical protein
VHRSPDVVLQEMDSQTPTNPAAIIAEIAMAIQAFKDARASTVDRIYLAFYLMLMIPTL